MGKNKFKKKAGETLEERRQRLRKAAQQLKRETSGKTKSKPKFSIDQLLDKAQDCIDRFEYELAQKFCQRALEMEPDNVRALETSGALLVDLGQLESAKQCYGRAITVCPNQGYSKYMNLGQLFEGAQAVECYQKGIELMLAEKQQKEQKEVATACGGGANSEAGGTTDRDGSGVTEKDVSSAYLAVAELYMTDCCFEEGAEEKCEAIIKKALECDPSNPDALQLRASLQISQGKPEEARETIKQSVALWLPAFQASEQPGPSTSAPQECSQSFESRLAAGKILIEVEEYELAVEVLETLLEEDDEVVDVWYLIGWAHHLNSDTAGARSYLSKAKKLYKKTGNQDVQLLQHIEELLQTLGTGVDDLDSDEEEQGDLEQAEKEIIQSDEENENQEESMDH